MTWPNPEQPPRNPYQQPGNPYQQPANPYQQQPPPGYGPAPPYPQPPRPTGTNSFAIASLVLGILCLWPLAVIFGVIALVQIKNRKQGGRGMAIAGLVLSGIWAVLTVVAVVLAATSEEQSVRATRLEVGDCISYIPDVMTVRNLTTIPCDKEHEGEVFAELTLPDGDFPSQSTINSSIRKCPGELESYAPSAATDPDVEISYVHPLESTWEDGDRTVICIATFEPKRAGSIKDE